MSIIELTSVEADDIQQLSREELAGAIIRGTCSFSELAEKEVVPIIIGQIARSRYEDALAGTFYRMTLLIRALSELKDPCHFQVANATARTVFELLLDLKLLSSDHSRAEKFFEFSKVSKFRKAQQLSEFLKANPGVDTSKHKHALQFAADPQRLVDVERTCIQHWGQTKAGKPNWQDHWSALSIADRAKEMGQPYEEIYRSQYFLQSYHTHAGGVGVDGMSRDGLICSFCMAHQLVQKLFAEALGIVATEFQLFATDQALRKKLRDISDASKFFAKQAMLEKLHVTESDEE